MPQAPGRHVAHLSRHPLRQLRQEECSTWRPKPLLPPALSHYDCFSGLRLAEQLGRREDEAKIRHGLGLSLWASGNLEESQHQVFHGLPYAYESCGSFLS